MQQVALFSCNPGWKEVVKPSNATNASIDIIQIRVHPLDGTLSFHITAYYTPEATNRGATVQVNADLLEEKTGQRARTSGA